MMEEEYKDYEIKWDDYSALFYAIKEGEKLKPFNRVEKCKKWIDQQTKKKFKRVDVFYCGWNLHSIFKKGVATSIVENSAWVSDSVTKERSKNNLSSVFIDSEENRLKITGIEAISAEMKRLGKKKSEIKESLETLKPEMMEI